MPSLAELYPSHRLGIEVSLWSADLGALAAEVIRLAPHADLFHIDASDTRFVSEALFFPDLLAALRPHTTVPFHVHLMAERATVLAESFACAGADLISVHAEAADALDAVAAIRSHGVSAGLALTLDTPIETVAEFLPGIDVALMVGTPLGTKGTEMASIAPDRIRAAREVLACAAASATPVVADGGIRAGTVPALVAAGADAVVAGSLILGSSDITATTQWLHRQHRQFTSPVGATQ